MSGPGRSFDKCPGRAGRPGWLGVAGRGSLISPGVEGRGLGSADPATLPTLAADEGFLLQQGPGPRRPAVWQGAFRRYRPHTTDAAVIIRGMCLRPGACALVVDHEAKPSSREVLRALVKSMGPCLIVGSAYRKNTIAKVVAKVERVDASSATRCAPSPTAARTARTVTSCSASSSSTTPPQRSASRRRLLDALHTPAYLPFSRRISPILAASLRRREWERCAAQALAASP